MSDKTTNYNFDTPGLDGAANIEVQDANWEKADTAIAAKVDEAEMENAFNEFLLGSVNGAHGLISLPLIGDIDMRHKGIKPGGAARPAPLKGGLSFKTGIYLSGNDRFLILSSGDIGTEDGDVAATVNDELHLLSEKVNSSDVLKKTNTTEFTPTGGYNPATKKYVDDKVKSKVVNGSSLSTLTLTVSSTIPTTLAAGTICFIPEA